MIAPRLVEQPVFVLSCIRSGSTLLRCILGTHPLVFAPHELHLTGLRVNIDSPYATTAMHAADLDTQELEHILWDRILYELLRGGGKKIIVEKTPGNARAWQRLAACWPKAKFIFLLRDPADILTSAIEARPDRDCEETSQIVLNLIDGVEQARVALDGHEVRYEHLVTRPEHTIASLCAFIGVAYEPRMLRYDVPQTLEPGIGDFTDKIRTGVVLAGRTGSPATYGPLADRRRRWGYADA
jgi:Sulfotransferase family